MKEFVKYNQGEQESAFRSIDEIGRKLDQIGVSCDDIDNFEKTQFVEMAKGKKGSGDDLLLTNAELGLPSEGSEEMDDYRADRDGEE